MADIDISECCTPPPSGPVDCQNTLSVRLKTDITSVGNVAPWSSFAFEIVNATPTSGHSTFTYPNSFSILQEGKYRISLNLSTIIENTSPPPTNYTLALIHPNLLGADIVNFVSGTPSGQDAATTHSAHIILNLFAADLPYSFQSGFTVRDNPPTETTFVLQPWTNISIERICDPQFEVDTTPIIL